MTNLTKQLQVEKEQEKMEIASEPTGQIVIMTSSYSTVPEFHHEPGLTFGDDAKELGCPRQSVPAVVDSRRRFPCGRVGVP